MSDSSRRSDADAIPQPIWDRVLQRLRNAELASDRRSSADILRRRRRDAKAAARGGRTAEQSREARALRRVFFDLGDGYREYRRRTGAAVSPEVRDAARRFRREPDLATLVSVAASLDRLDPLSW